MKIWQEHSEIIDGERVQIRRQVEMPDNGFFISAEEAKRREPQVERERQRDELREAMRLLLIDRELGADVSAQIEALRQQWRALA